MARKGLSGNRRGREKKSPKKSIKPGKMPHSPGIAQQGLRPEEGRAPADSSRKEGVIRGTEGLPESTGELEKRARPRAGRLVPLRGLRGRPGCFQGWGLSSAGDCSGLGFLGHYKKVPSTVCDRSVTLQPQ